MKIITNLRNVEKLCPDTKKEERFSLSILKIGILYVLYLYNIYAMVKIHPFLSEDMTCDSD